MHERSSGGGNVTLAHLVADPRLRLARSQAGLNSSSLAGQMSGSAEAPSQRQGVRIGHPRRRVKLMVQLLERRSEGYADYGPTAGNYNLTFHVFTS